METIFAKIKYYLRHPIVGYYLRHPILLFKNRIVSYFLWFKKTAKRDINFNDGISSPIPIDIVIVAANKDLEVLEYVIDSVRIYIRHTIGKIIIISPKTKTVMRICKTKNCTFVNEDSVLPITKRSIKYKVNGIDRSGWLFQQILKWGAEKYVKSNYFLVADADTIFTRPQIFIYDHKVILTANGQFCYIPFFETYRKLLGNNFVPLISFTSHHILIEKSKLKQLESAIERHSKTKWYKAIIEKINKNEISSVSDYDTYGQFVYSRYPGRFILEHWFNLSLDRAYLKKIPKILNEGYNYGKYKTVSFHSYKNNTITK